MSLPGVIAVLLVLCWASGYGIYCCWTALAWNRESRRFAQTGLRVPAVVTAMDTSSERPFLYLNIAVRRPAVQYQTFDGRAVSVPVEVGIRRSRINVGERVQVAYDPTSPERARLVPTGLLEWGTWLRFSLGLLYVIIFVPAVLGFAVWVLM